MKANDNISCTRSAKEANRIVRLIDLHADAAKMKDEQYLGMHSQLIKLVQSKKHCLQKKNEKPTMTAAALAPKNDSKITFAMK